MALRILLVDDELNVLKSLKRVLVRSGFTVATASSGYEAIEFLRTNSVSVIVTDFRMPGMNGADLLRHVKHNWPDCVSLVLSGYADYKSVVELHNQGLAFRFLEKPWVDAELLENIHHAHTLYEKQRAKRIRDQLLMGSMSALIEVQNDGIISRFNAPTVAIIPEISAYQEHHIACLDIAQEKQAIESFLAKKSSTLFINDSKIINNIQNKEVMIERYLSDDFCQLLKLSVNSINLNDTLRLSEIKPALTDESDFYELLDVCQANNEYYAVVYVGVAQFQLINDLLGNEDAHKLIQLVLGVLRTFCEKQVKICHKHSGRFLLYIPQAVSDTELLTDLNQAMNDLSYVLPSRYTGMHVQLYGVYGLFPEDNLVGKELINQMRLAMSYQVSNQQRFFTRFDAEIVADYKKNFELSRLLLTAISKDQFSLHFQPKIDARTQKTHGSEVLLRWFEPIEFGWVSPAQFIAIAECDGQIIAIGRWVISQSCKMLKQWADKNIDVGPLAINVSGRQLKEDPGWIDYTLDCMKLNQLSASQFQFELTETYLIEDFRQCEQQLIRLRALGFEVLIDDFGVGYSSLAYLSKLPLDGVKLDKILINDVESSLGTQSMIRNITRMSHDLNLKVIAEGVETEEQFELIKKLGCDYIQGFYFSKPLTPDAFCTYLQDESKQGGQ